VRRVLLAALVVVAIVLAVLAFRMSSKRGYASEVLLRVSSPDGTLAAVCQTVPALDGPTYTVRLEREDGGVVRTLFDAGDGEPCSEMVWSKDGRALGVLSAQVARTKFVDIEWVVKNASDTRRLGWREVSFGSESQTMLARGLRFTGPLEAELDVCPYRLADRQRDGYFTCTAPPVVKKFEIPRPLLTAQF
jgi:hypothetical protein